MAAEESGGSGAKPEGSRTFLRHGDFISLFVEGSKAKSGYVSLESFSTDLLSVYPGASPPNFQQSCVFQVLNTADDANLGDVIHYGEVFTLMHRGTQKILAKRSTASDTGHHAVILQTDLNEYAHFRPMPRFKLHSEGDPIRLNDQVLFESNQGTDHRTYMHFRNEVFDLSTSKTTGVRVKLFAPYNVSSDAFRHVLKGGDFVRLFHQEANGFLVVTKHEAAFHDTDSFLTDLPTVCLRQLPDGKNPEDYHDASSLWQIELKESDRRGGRPIQWNDGVRLKNVLHDAYLSISAKNPNGSLSINSDPRNPDAILDMVESTASAEEDQASTEAVSYTSFFYIQRSGQWLHIDRTHESHEGDDEEDTVDFIEATFERRKFDEDAFMLSAVEQGDIREFYFANSQLGELKILAGLDSSDPDGLTKEFNAAYKALAQLIKFCSKDDEDLKPEEFDGDPLTLHQNMLADLRIDDTVMAFVSKAFSQADHCHSWQPPYSPQLLPRLEQFNVLAKLSYKVLRQMSKENGHVGFHIARKFKEAMTNQCRLLGQIPEVAWDIADTLEEMFRDNELLLRVVDQSYIKTYIRMMCESYTFQDLRQYVTLLSSFCSHDEHPLPEAQDAIRHELCEAGELIPETHLDDHDPSHCLVSARIEVPGKVFTQWPIKTLPIEVYVKDAEHAHYFEAVLDLLAQICLHRRHESQHLVRTDKFVPFHELMAALDNPNLDHRIKAAYCHLCLHLYIDSDPLQERTTILNREFDDLADEQETKKAQKAMTALFDTERLLQWIEDFFADHEDTLLKLTVEQEHHALLHGHKRKHLTKQEEQTFHKLIEKEHALNHLGKRVLEMVKELLKLGFYHEGKRVHNLTEMLLDLLWNSHADSEAAYSESASHDVVMEAKMLICDCLSKLLDMDLNDKLTELLVAFREEYNHKTHKHLDLHAHGRLKQSPMFSKRESGSFKWFRRLDYSDENLIYLLLDLTEYDHEELRISALNLLTRSFNVKGELLSLLKEVTLIVEKEEMNMLHQLRDNVKRLEADEHEDLHSVAAEMKKILNWLSLQCFHKPQEKKAKPVKFGDDAFGDWAGGNGKHTVQPLRLVDANNKPSANSAFEPWTVPGVVLLPNAPHQDMMRHEHVHKVVMELLEEHLGTKDDEHVLSELAEPGARDLFEAAFRFLSFFCQGNHKNQLTMTEDHFKFIVHVCKFGIHAEDTLFRILEDNDHAHDEELHEAHIVHLIKNVFEHAHSRTGVYFRLLQKIVAPKGHGEREMQNMISDQFFGHEGYRETLYERGGVDYSQGRFMDFIVQTFSPDFHMTPEHRATREYFVELLHFFALLADDDNTYTKGTIQNEVPLEMAILPLTTELNIPLDMKRVFILYVGNVFYPSLALSDVEELQSSTQDDDKEEDGAEEESYGFSTDHAARLEANQRLAAMFTRDLKRLTRQLKMDPHSTQHDIDSYVFSSCIPFINCFLRHAVKDLLLEEEGVQAHVDKFAGLAKELVASIIDFVVKRHQLDENDTRLKILHSSLLAGAHCLHDLMELNDVEVIRLQVYTAKGFVTMEEEHSYYHNDEEREDLKAMSTAHRTKAHRSKAHRSHKTHGSHKHGTRGIFSHGGRHKTGKGKNTVGTNRFVAFDSEHTATPSELVADELYTFIHQVKELFAEHHRPVDCRLVQDCEHRDVFFDFREFWDLVHVIRTELLTHRHAQHLDHAKEIEAQALKHKEELLMDAGEANGATPAAQLTTTAVRGKSAKAGLARKPSKVAPGMELQPVIHRHHVHKKHLDNSKFSFDINACFAKICAHFRHHGSGDEEEHHHHHQLDEFVEEVIVQWLRVMCALLSHDEDSEANTKELRAVAARLNKLELPGMALFLSSTKHMETVELSLRLAGLLLTVSPTETAVEITHLDYEHPHSQKAFLNVLRTPIGRKAMVGFRRRLEEHRDELHKREHETEVEAAHRDQAEENLSTNVILGILRLVGALCDGVNLEMQNFMRHQDSTIDQVNIVGLITELSHSYARIVKSKMELGFDFEELRRKEAVTERVKELQREINDCHVLVELYKTLSELISGPNRHNQKELLNHKVCEPMLLFLSYMEYTSGTSIDDYVDQVQSALEVWEDQYKVEAKKNGDFVQDDKAGVTVSAKQLDDLQLCWDIVEDLEGIDEDCENSVLQLLLGLLEGRKAGDDVYDLICNYLFESKAASGAGGDVFMHNLDKHYRSGHAEHGGLDEELAQRYDAEDGSRHYSDAEVSFTYYILLKVLADESKTYGPRLQRKLEAWEHKNNADLGRKLGRIEIVRNNELEALYFPVPVSVTATEHRPIVRELRQHMIDSTVLENSQQKIVSFLAQSGTFAKVVLKQANYQGNPVLKLLSNEILFTYAALVLAVVINIDVIFELSGSYITVLAIIQLFMGALMFVGYWLNRFPIDEERFAVQRRKSKLVDGPVLQVFRFIDFWLTDSRIAYQLLYMIAAVLGIVVSKAWFAFHLFDITLRVEVMSLVLQAVRQNLSKLMATFALAFLLLYTFSLIGQAAFKGRYGFDSGVVQCEGRHTFLACLRDHLYYGFINAPVFDRAIPSVGAFVFSLVYFITIVLVMTSIVAGIIIDSFGELRHNSEAIASEKLNRCFVCSFSRDTLEAASKHGFVGHQKIEHSIWHYVYFMIYLDLKESHHKHLSGAEMYFLRERRLGRSHTLIPIGRAMCMEGQAHEAKIEDVLKAVEALAAEAAEGRARMAAMTDQVTALASLVKEQA